MLGWAGWYKLDGWLDGIVQVCILYMEVGWDGKGWLVGWMVD